MIDTYLMYQLLRAIPSHAKMVIIGDVNQLPSIGPGCVLKDLISSETIPTVRLNAIFRQARGSQIILNAHRINEGQMPFCQSFPNSDFFFVEAKEPDQVRSTILDLVTKKIPQEHRFDSKKEIQVLVPMRKGICGIDMLNRDLQERLTPEHSGFHFRMGDKVMQLRNNYSKDVYNGDIGYVSRIDHEEEQIAVQMDDKEVLYEFSEADELALAYAVSIHKYQGSECPCVVMPVHTTHFKLLTKNLLYTGVTRGKKLVFLVGTKKALAIAVKNEEVLQRYTGLKTRLRAGEKIAYVAAGSAGF
jgi:exodeoxyribonuclease V alpha subunit